VRETLKTHQTVTLVLPTDEKTELRIRKSSTPEPVHRELYEKLAVPTEIFRSRRTWVSIGDLRISGSNMHESLCINTTFRKARELGYCIEIMKDVCAANTARGGALMLLYAM
jgi:hypothetical protein